MSPESKPGTVSSVDARPVIVVPCYNEALRIDVSAFVDLAESGSLRLLFVDDGSTDGTETVLDRLRRESEAISVLGLPLNRGKAEAVRQGLLHAVGAGAAITGYLDADLSTPGNEMIRLVRTLEARNELTAVFGSRISRLGSQIRRSPVRHYTGRMFATFASLALGIAVYDTQCGAKVFRVNDTFVSAISTPFRSSWSFDVILCQRLMDGTSTVPGLPATSLLEVPLDRWSDVGGSKLNLTGSLSAFLDVVVVGVHRYSRQRKAGRVPPSREV
jgi:dolichyl-phosphate beta-glucosyltransferase